MANASVAAPRAAELVAELVAEEGLEEVREAAAAAEAQTAFDELSAIEDAEERAAAFAERATAESDGPSGPDGGELQALPPYLWQTLIDDNPADPAASLFANPVALVHSGASSSGACSSTAATS